IDTSTYNENCIIHSIIRTWKQIKSQFDNESMSILLPIAKNPSFVPSTLDSGYIQWKELGIRTIGDLLVDGNFASFSQLQAKFGLHKHNHFRYLQVRAYVKKHTHTLENIIPTEFDELFKLGGGEGHLISQFYNMLLLRSSPSTQGLRTGWEQELGSEISDELWKASLENIHKCSVFPNTSPLCDKCHTEEATLLHSYSLCTKLTPFWSGIFKILSDMFHTELRMEPLLIILGVSGQLFQFNKRQQQLLSYAFIIGKKLVLMFWKKAEVPSVKLWL
uniref:Uncharacterized protein n=1 Tax=Poecilia formosa TaxID=48698 RepID=A0A096MFQ8_POEFO